MDGLGTANNNSPREGHLQSQSADVEQHGSDTNNCHDVNANEMGEGSNNNSSSVEPSDAATQSSTTNSTAGDTMIKERPRSILRQSGSSNTADDNISRVGAHHVNESAPNINRRFFNGMSNRNARLRAREERRLHREGNMSGTTTNNNQNNNGEINNDVEISAVQSQPLQTQSRRDLLMRMESTRSLIDGEISTGHSQQLQTQSRRDLLMRMESTRSLMEDDFNSSSERIREFNSSTDSISRMRSRRNLFSRRPSNSNLGNQDNFTPQPVSRMTSRMPSRRNIFSRMTSNSNLFHNHNNNNNNNLNELAQSMISQTHSITATLVEDDDVVIAEPFTIDDNDANNVPLPDSEVGRIISRLEHRSTNRVPVSSDVKWRFLRLCDEACINRVEKMRETMDLDEEEEDVDNASDGSCSGSSSYDSGSDGSSSNSSHDTDTLKPTNQKRTKTTTASSPCILREDIIQIRNTVRLAYESRTKIQRFQKLARSVFGFRDVDKALLNVLNRAVDSIDESGHVEAKKRRAITRRASSLVRSDSMNVLNQGGGLESLGSSPNEMLLRTNSSRLEVGGGVLDDSNRSFGSQLQHDDESNNKNGTINNLDDEKLEWFYYKDFAFYNLKVESKYPWVRNTGLFSLFVTVMFLIFTPILWCVILRDEK